MNVRENPDLYKAHFEKDRNRKLSERRRAKAKMSNTEREEFRLKERVHYDKRRTAVVN